MQAEIRDNEMPTTGIGLRNFHNCFPRTKRPSPIHPSRPLPTSTADVAAASMLFKNFNSLYNHAGAAGDEDDDVSSEDVVAAVTPDLATIYASHRFFVSPPGQSNSIVESTPTPHEPPPVTVAGGGVAVPKYSPDPYADFRGSMQEMVEARGLVDVGSNWEDLHELLLCYLALNPKSAHEFILGAFADLIVNLMSSPTGGISRQVSDFAVSDHIKIPRRQM